MSRLALGILGSGRGTNCRAILQRIRDGCLEADVRVVISDVMDAPILDIARDHAVPNACLPSGHFRTRLEPNTESDLVRMLRDCGVEMVILAGFMRVLKAPMLEAFPRKILNIHPSLLPLFPGLMAWKQALDAGHTVTGCTVHYVDDQIDHGTILAQGKVPILPNDTPDALHERIQVEERRLYPEVIGRFCPG